MNRDSVAGVLMFCICSIIVFPLIYITTNKKEDNSKEKQDFIYRNICNSDSLKYYITNTKWN